MKARESCCSRGNGDVQKEGDEEEAFSYHEIIQRLRNLLACFLIYPPTLHHHDNGHFKRTDTCSVSYPYPHPGSALQMMTRSQNITAVPYLSYPPEKPTRSYFISTFDPTLLHLSSGDPRAQEANLGQLMVYRYLLPARGRTYQWYTYAIVRDMVWGFRLTSEGFEEVFPEIYAEWLRLC